MLRIAVRERYDQYRASSPPQHAVGYAPKQEMRNRAPVMGPKND